MYLNPVKTSAVVTPKLAAILEAKREETIEVTIAPFSGNVFVSFFAVKR